MKIRCLFFIFLFLLILVNVSAEITNAEYNVFIEENGNSVVAINFEGSGEITIPLEKDIESLLIEGGLYVIENNSATIAIGSTKKAVVVYKTGLFTKKINNTWEFTMNLENKTNKKIVITMPKSTVIKETTPKALIETTDYVKIYFEDFSEKKVSFVYYFPANTKESINLENLQDKKNHNIILFVLFIILIMILIGILLYRKKKRRVNMKNRFLETLTENEKKVVQLLIDKNKPLKRSFIEKNLDFAKSSLAATINNLERKKIVEVDRSYTTHVIKLGKLLNANEI